METHMSGLQGRVALVTGASQGIGRACAIALAEAVASGKIQRGDLILLVVFGAGLTWGAAVIEW